MDYLQLADQCKGLTHPVRLQILDMLRGGELCVCHIERALNRRQAYVSQQLMVLRDAGWVEARKEGLQVFYRLADAPQVGWLGILFGADTTPMHRLEGCTCPLCAVISLEMVR